MLGLGFEVAGAGLLRVTGDADPSLASITVWSGCVWSGCGGCGVWSGCGAIAATEVYRLTQTAAVAGQILSLQLVIETWQTMRSFFLVVLALAVALVCLVQAGPVILTSGIMIRVE